MKKLKRFIKLRWKPIGIQVQAKAVAQISTLVRLLPYVAGFSYRVGGNYLNGWRRSSRKERRVKNRH